MLQHLLPAAGSMVGPVAACIEAAAAKSETSKCAFVDSGVHVLLIDAVRQPGMSHDALRPVCGALRSFSTADDSRPTTSRYTLLMPACCEDYTVIT